MARPIKTGLGSYPFDVDFFSDLKVRKLIKFQGSRAVVVYTCLLCSIYQNGYYCKWNEDMLFTTAEQTGCEAVFTREVILSCLNIGLFDKKLFNSERVLTSRGIQRRYLELCRRRHVEIREYNLLDDAPRPQTRTGTKKPETCEINNVVSGDLEIPISTVVGKLKADESWKQAISNKGIPPEKIPELLDAWELHCISIGQDSHASIKSAKRHFVFWIDGKKSAKTNNSRETKSNASNPPTIIVTPKASEVRDYSFNGGFGGMDV